MTARSPFVADHASQYPVTFLCRVLAIPRSGYDRWNTVPPRAHAQRDTMVSAQIVAVFTRSRQTYGSPRVQAALTADGLHVSRKRVARVMRQAGLGGRCRRARHGQTTDSRHDQPIAANVLNRQFPADRPNHAWVSDITDVPTREGWQEHGRRARPVRPARGGVGHAPNAGTRGGDSRTA